MGSSIPAIGVGVGVDVTVLVGVGVFVGVGVWVGVDVGVGVEVGVGVGVGPSVIPDTLQERLTRVIITINPMTNFFIKPPSKVGRLHSDAVTYGLKGNMF